MHPATVIFVVSCIATFGLCLVAKDTVAAFLSVAMLGICGGATVLWFTNSMQYAALLDLPIATAAYVLWLEDAGDWAESFLTLFCMRLGVHVIGEMAGSEWQVGYYHALNITFMGALAVLGSKGVWDVVSSCVRGLLRLRDGLAARRSVLA